MLCPVSLGLLVVVTTRAAVIAARGDTPGIASEGPRDPTHFAVVAVRPGITPVDRGPMAAPSTALSEAQKRMVIITTEAGLPVNYMYADNVRGTVARARGGKGHTPDITLMPHLGTACGCMKTGVMSPGGEGVLP